MRAKLPVEEGFVERDGVELHYEVYGNGAETMVFLPPWSIVHSRVYKAQLPYFSERFRCVTYDGRGNGQSDRPDDVAAYTLANYVADALAVMDATEAGPAIIVGLSFGAMIACILAAYHPERVGAAILVGTAAIIGPGYPYMGNDHFLPKRDQFKDWDKYNRDYWLSNYPDFAEHFVGNIFFEPHSTKQIEDGIAWACETTGPVLVRTVEARTTRRLRSQRGDVSQDPCPVLMIHGDDDRIQPYARAQARGGADRRELVTIEGGGHNPLGRIPAKCNTLIVEFLDRRLGLSRQTEADRDAPTGKARALSVLADRARPWPSRHRHYARTAQASSPICKSTGWRRIR